MLPVPAGPHFRPGYLEGYYQLNFTCKMMISFGDQGQVKLTGSLKQQLNDQSPWCTLRLNQVAFKILHPQRQQNKELIADTLWIIAFHSPFSLLTFQEGRR